MSEDTNDGNELAKKFLEPAYRYERLVATRSAEIRRESEEAYGDDLRLMRLAALSGIAHLLWEPPARRGLTNPSVSDRLVLICAFAQGLPVTERLISEGQYAKAAAALKQDFESLARIGEVMKGTHKHGVTPNAKEAPPGTQPLYGKLNALAHPSRINVLESTLRIWSDDGFGGLDPIPHFKRELATEMFEMHAYMLYAGLDATLTVFREMYPSEHEFLRPAIIARRAAESHGIRAGFLQPRP